MPVLLRQSSDLPGPEVYAYWFAVTGTTAALDPARKLPDLARRLEEAFMDTRETWWRLGREMGAAPTAEIAHAPTGGAFGSDFGVMLAWGRLTRKVAAANESFLIVCDDPWLFRHLATRPGVRAGEAPSLFQAEVRLRLRGVLARAKTAAKLALAALTTKPQQKNIGTGATALLVYGHPASNAQGYDTYFGSLMTDHPQLNRLLHTDCPPGRARELADDGRTASLHAWGRPLFAFRLLSATWQPARNHMTGAYGWLVRRAAARENSGGGPAMNRWQLHCQENFITTMRPARLAWPWENHAWERGLCRTARTAGVATLGYQHTVVGPHQINYATYTNPDGLASIPDVVACDGPAYRDELLAWGVPEDRLVIGGAFRFEQFEKDLYDPDGPVFVPLSATPAAARAQVAAAQRIADGGRRVLVKDHPMYPFAFEETDTLARTHEPLPRQKGISAVLFCTGTSGLEALLAGLPTFRLMLEDRIAIDVLPRGIEAHAVSVETAAETLAAARRPAHLNWQSVLAPVDALFWRDLLFGGRPGANVSQAQEIREAS